MKETTYGKPQNANRWHVFADGRSLCGKYGDFMVRTYPTEKYRNDLELCGACQKKLNKLVDKGMAKTYESASADVPC